MTAGESKPTIRLHLFVVYLKKLPAIHDLGGKQLKVGKF
jgi:hypothetical protein